MAFIDDETIMSFCQSCAMLETRISRKTQRSYLFCKSYNSACFKCLEECKRKIHAIELKAMQKNLDAFSDGV